MSRELNDLEREFYEKALDGTLPWLQPNNYYEVGRYTDYTEQSSGLADERVVVTFGAGGADPLGILSLDSAGVFTALKSGPIAVKQRIRLTRPSTAGVSYLFFQAQVSLDGGTTWAAIGDTQHEAIDESGDIDIFLDVSFINVTAGIKLRATWAQSSDGIADATLSPTSPTAAMLLEGWTDVGSAETVIYALNGHNYE